MAVSSMYCSGTVAVWCTQVGAVLTVPYFVGLHREDFDTGEWGVWFRVFSFALVCASGVVGVAANAGGSRVGKKIACAGMITSALATVYNVLFGIRTSVLTLCSNDISDACMESPSPCPVTVTQTLGNVRDWQAFLFSFTLCVLLCSETLGIALLLRELRDVGGIVSGETMTQSAWDTSFHATSPTKAKGGKGDSVERTDLMDPVFVPSKDYLSKSSQVTELTSTKNGSLPRGSQSLRGRGKK